MNYHEEFLEAAELHDVDRLRRLLDAGLNANAPIRGIAPIEWLTSMYTRSDGFADCYRLLIERGAEVDDEMVAAVLSNDLESLTRSLTADAHLVHHRTTLTSAFTPLDDVTLLHVAAEFQNEGAARILLQAGADVDAKAGVDSDGLNGQTPLFHAVNSNENRAEPILRLLLDAGARTDIRLAGITWGRGFDWETTIFDVTPISYAQFGLLPQMHRRATDTYDNIRLLLEASSRPVPPLTNIPNRYVHGP